MSLSGLRNKCFLPTHINPALAMGDSQEIFRIPSWFPSSGTSTLTQALMISMTVGMGWRAKYWQRNAFTWKRRVSLLLTFHWPKQVAQGAGKEEERKGQNKLTSFWGEREIETSWLHSPTIVYFEDDSCFCKEAFFIKLYFYMLHTLI